MGMGRWGYISFSLKNISSSKFHVQKQSNSFCSLKNALKSMGIRTLMEYLWPLTTAMEIHSENLDYSKISLNLTKIYFTKKMWHGWPFRRAKFTCLGKSRKENPQKLTQLSSRSHPRHLVGKRTAQKTPT